MAHANLTRQLAQREALDAVLAQAALGLGEQCATQVAVVIGALAASAREGNGTM